MALSPPEMLYISVITPIINTENSIDQPDITWTITAVAKNLTPSARTRVTKNIRDDIFWSVELNLIPISS